MMQFVVSCVLLVNVLVAAAFGMVGVELFIDGEAKQWDKAVTIFLAVMVALNIVILAWWVHSWNQPWTV